MVTLLYHRSLECILYCDNIVFCVVTVCWRKD